MPQPKAIRGRRDRIGQSSEHGVARAGWASGAQGARGVEGLVDLVAATVRYFLNPTANCHPWALVRGRGLCPGWPSRRLSWADYWSLTRDFPGLLLDDHQPWTCRHERLSRQQ